MAVPPGMRWDGGWARFSGCCPESPISCPYEGLGKKRTAKNGCPTQHAMGRRLGTIYSAPTCQIGEGLLFENGQQSNHRATGPSHYEITKPAAQGDLAA